MVEGTWAEGAQSAKLHTLMYYYTWTIHLHLSTPWHLMPMTSRKVLLFNPFMVNHKTLTVFFAISFIFFFVESAAMVARGKGGDVYGEAWERPQQWKSWKEIHARHLGTDQKIWHQIFSHPLSPNSRLYYPWARCSYSSNPPMSAGACTFHQPRFFASFLSFIPLRISASRSEV